MAGTWTTPSDFANEHTVTDAEWNALLGAAGNLTLVPRVASRDVVTATVGGSAAETTVYTEGIAGGALTTERMMRVTMIAQLASPAGVGSQTCIIRGKFGGTTFASGTLTFAENTTNAIRCEFLIAANNATNAQKTASRMSSASVAGLATLQTEVNALIGGFALTIDTTTSQTLLISVQNSSSNASFVFSCYAVFLELLQ